MSSEMWYFFLFFLKIVVIVVRLKLYDLTVMAAGVQMNEFANEFVIASFAER